MALPADISEALGHHWRSLLTAAPAFVPVIRSRMDDLLDAANRREHHGLSHHEAMRRDYLCELDDQRPTQ